MSFTGVNRAIFTARSDTRTLWDEGLDVVLMCGVVVAGWRESRGIYGGGGMIWSGR